MTKTTIHTFARFLTSLAWVLRRFKAVDYAEALEKSDDLDSAGPLRDYWGTVQDNKPGDLAEALTTYLYNHPLNSLPGKLHGMLRLRRLRRTDFPTRAMVTRWGLHFEIGPELVRVVSAQDEDVETMVEGVRLWGRNAHCYDAGQVESAIMADIESGCKPMCASETILYLFGGEREEGRTWDNWEHLDELLEDWLGCCL